MHPLAVGAVQDLFDAAEGSMDADESWRELAARFRSAERAVPEVSPLLRAELRDYQFDGFAWMIRLARWGAGACLADDMGLGKTVQTIAVLLELTREGPALIVAPTSVCYNWENEIARFAPTLRTHRLAAPGTAERNWWRRWERGRAGGELRPAACGSGRAGLAPVAHGGF